ncbi:MAG: YggT family protein [Pseudomonadales bacterium]|nr:YggT family protein [Pseudomonadales bacterium]
MNPTGALELIITMIFDVYIMIVVARFILQLVRADFYNPVSQFIVKATSPVLTPLRRIVPGFGGLDVASIVLFMVLVFLKLLIWLMLKGFDFSVIPSLDFVILLLRSMANTIINFFLFCIFIMVVLSWVSQGSYNPMADIMRQVTEPIMAPARKLLPPMGGLDLSPMIVILLLMVIKEFFMLSGAP